MMSALPSAGPFARYQTSCQGPSLRRPPALANGVALVLLTAGRAAAQRAHRDPLAQLLGDLGALRGDVVLLERILVHVVELLAVFAPIVDQPKAAVEEGAAADVQGVVHV